jgi:Glu-tRNA(Gln) amidotransferase subunit E-like FAD-binding protein
MNAVILEPKNEADFKAIEMLAQSLGINSFTISDMQKKYLAGLKMVEIADSLPKYDITDEEISSMVKEAEEEYYSGKKK